MARWRLRAGHYLKVPGTEWEYKETDQATGRLGRKVFEVPLYLHPDIISDQNYDGNVCVCNGRNCLPRDYVFEGPPTPDMEPMDDEAQAITDKHKYKWVHPIESLDGTFGEAMIRQFASEMSKLQMPTPPVSIPNVSAKEFEQLKAMVAELQKQNAELKSVKRRF